MEINQIPPVNPQPHHVHPSMKFVMLAFCIALVAVLGFLVWTQNRDYVNDDYTAPTVKKQATNNTEEKATGEDETADWETYTNSEFGFSVMYPDGWQATYSDVEDTYVVGSLGISKERAQDPSIVISVDRRSVSSVVEAEKNIYASGYTFLGQEEVDLNATPATKLSFQSVNSPELKPIIYVATAGNYVLRITDPNNATDTENYSTLLKIFNTIKVTK